MQMVKFEEKAAEFLKENNLINPIDGRGTIFTIHVLSSYNNKKLAFQTTSFMFEVTSDNVEELFDKAFRVLKSYGPKATRERSKGEVDNTTEGEQE